MGTPNEGEKAPDLVTSEPDDGAIDFNDGVQADINDTQIQTREDVARIQLRNSGVDHPTQQQLTEAVRRIFPVDAAGNFIDDRPAYF